MAGFLVFAPRYTSPNNTSAFGLVTSGGNSPEANTRIAWLPLATTVRTGTMISGTVPGTGNTFSTRAYSVNGGTYTPLGTSVALVGNSVTVRGPMNADLPVADVPSLTTASSISLFGKDYSGSPTSTTIRDAFTYTCQPTTIPVCWIGVGTNTNPWTGSGATANTFYMLNNSGAPSSATESQVQRIWPVRGTFKYFLTSQIQGTVGDVECAIRVNGVDFIVMTKSPVAGLQVGEINLKSIAPVTAGDLVCIRLKRLSGDASIVPNLVIGFTSYIATDEILTVTESGVGTGKVTSDGIHCPITCTSHYDKDTVIDLLATPTGVSTFTKWNGADVPVGHEFDNPLQITMNANKTIDAQFD